MQASRVPAPQVYLPGSPQPCFTCSSNLSPPTAPPQTLVSPPVLLRTVPALSASIPPFPNPSQACPPSHRTPWGLWPGSPGSPSLLPGPAPHSSGPRPTPPSPWPPPPSCPHPWRPAPGLLPSAAIAVHTATCAEWDGHPYLSVSKSSPDGSESKRK